MQESHEDAAHLISSRLGRSGQDPIFALDAEARARKARGDDILNGTLGALLDDEGALAVLPTAAQAIRDVPAVEWASYAPISGLPAFLEAVVQDVFGTRPALAAQSIAVATPGGSGALRHAIASFLEPGQTLLTPSFYWGPYETLAEENERRLTTFPMFAGQDALDLAALESALERVLAEQGRALLILNDPCNNPSGYSMSAEDWRGVRDIVARHAAAGPITLEHDNAYAASGPADGRATALAALAEISQH
ncbi:MAG: aminotransferase class I/II-fold pyridoxal phosphate-dependent enzyme, partial [Planctomycetota bacterium]|nr:aminotransferase class I/II-fold pyridoxal phosphate-dependent enzyme [Planctomycetota bacterium]